MELISNVVIAHQWLAIGLKTQQQTTNDFQKEFYISKYQTMRYYFKYELPKTKAALETLLNKDKLTVESEDEPFLL